MMHTMRSLSLRFRIIPLVVLLLGLSVLVGCYRGRPTEKAPIHLVPNMDDQQKYEAMEYTTFFPNNAIMRVPPAGTVARGSLQDDPVIFTGKTPDGQLVARMPIVPTLPVLQRGQERFNIYCSPCHGRIGDGKGIVVQRGYLPPPTFHDARLREMPDGHIFDVISHGIRNMPSYAQQIPVSDRWAIVAYFRALQRSQNAEREDIPDDVLRRIQP